MVRIPKILSVMDMSRSTWWAGVRAGRFPQPVKFGRNPRWRARDIRALMEYGEIDAARHKRRRRASAQE